MSHLTVYRLSFQSGLHVGTRGVNLEESRTHIPSDTLFAALVDVVRRMGGEPDDFVALFPRLEVASADASSSSYVSQTGEPPFLLTSTFPFAGAVHFFPMPVALQRFFQEETLKSRRKELRRIRFVSKDLFLRMLKGERLDDWLFPEDEEEEPTAGVALQGGAFWLTLEECGLIPGTLRKDRGTDRRVPLRALRHRQVFAMAQVPRVTIDRITSSSGIFHAGRVHFASGCGLWFGVDWRRPQATVGESGLTYQETLSGAMAMLVEEGIGGERSVGYGTFTYEEEQAPLILEDPSPGGLALLLSRYHPRQSELPGALTGGGTAYDLAPVGGWLRSWDGAAERRKRLWLVAEGSIVRSDESAVLGEIVDVRPTHGGADAMFPHPVWRYGLAFPVGYLARGRGKEASDE
jgi:CRISPR-associated protein Csm4